MKKTILIATALAAGMAANAEKLYLSGIECTKYSWPSGSDSSDSSDSSNGSNGSDFSFKSLFQYDDDDNLTQIDISRYINRASAARMTLPESVLYQFEYDDKTLKHARYIDSDGKSLTGTARTIKTEDGEIIYTSVSSPDAEKDHVFRAEYNEEGLLVVTERLSASGESHYDPDDIYLYDDIMVKYMYSYDAEGEISYIQLINYPGKGQSQWHLKYNDGVLTTCDYFDYRINTINVVILEFSYYDENEIGENTIVVTPNPIPFIYASLYDNLYDYTIYSHSFFIPDCISRMIAMQQNKILKTVRIRYGCNLAYYTFDCRYQNERPSAGLGVAVADDIEPVYYNIQGMRVINPVDGELYITVRGNQVVKEVYHR